jgi:hypothetical protein
VTESNIAMDGRRWTQCVRRVYRAASAENVDRAAFHGGVVVLVAAHALRGAGLANGPDREGVTRERHADAAVVVGAGVGRLEVCPRAREVLEILRILSQVRALSRNQT